MKKWLKPVALSTAFFGLCVAQANALSPYDPCSTSTAKSYEVVNRWGESLEDKYGGVWFLGGRRIQKIDEISLNAAGEGTLSGKVRYSGEGFIDVLAVPTMGSSCYSVHVSWGEGRDRTTRFDGYWRIGGRDNQSIVSMQATEGAYSSLNGTCTYEGEGPIEFIGYRR